MADNALTPYFAQRQAHLSSGITDQAGPAALPLDPAEFDRRYGTLPAYTEKSFAAIEAALLNVEKGINAESAADYTAAHKAGMTAVSVGTPTTGYETRYVDQRPEAERAAIQPVPAPQPIDLATIGTEEELLKSFGASNVFSAESFAAARYSAREMGLPEADATAAVEKGMASLVKTTVAGRRGLPVERWVPASKVVPAAAAEAAGTEAGTEAAAE